MGPAQSNNQLKTTPIGMEPKIKVQVTTFDELPNRQTAKTDSKPTLI